jgi:hypothetical protein
MSAKTLLCAFAAIPDAFFSTITGCDQSNNLESGKFARSLATGIIWKSFRYQGNNLHHIIPELILQTHWTWLYNIDGSCSTQLTGTG